MEGNGYGSATWSAPETFHVSNTKVWDVAKRLSGPLALPYDDISRLGLVASVHILFEIIWSLKCRWWLQRAGRDPQLAKEAAESARWWWLLILNGSEAVLVKEEQDKEDKEEKEEKLKGEEEEGEEDVEGEGYGESDTGITSRRLSSSKDLILTLQFQTFTKLGVNTQWPSKDYDTYPDSTYCVYHDDTDEERVNRCVLKEFFMERVKQQ